jgi:hypothetical protein
LEPRNDDAGAVTAGTIFKIAELVCLRIPPGICCQIRATFHAGVREMGRGDPILRPVHLTACGKRGLFGRIFGLDGRESYRELRLELLCCPTV